MERYEEILQELKLRRLVRKAIKIRETKNKQSLVSERRDEEKLRKVIRSLLKEGDIDSDTKPAPYESTPINMLADAFNQILPVIKTGLRKLSKPEERQSYRLHVLEKLKSSFDTFESLELKAAAAAKRDDNFIGESDLTEAEEDEELSLKIRMLGDEGRILPSDESENVRFRKEEKSEEQKTEENFGSFRISGLNPTGARVAFETINDSNIESVLADKRRTLFDSEDKSEFKEYTLYNADLWLLTYEEELSKEMGQGPAFQKTIMPRPDTAKEIGKGAEFAPGAGEVADMADAATEVQDVGAGIPTADTEEEENTEFTF